MNKAELIDFIATAAKLTKADAGRALDATVDAVSGALKEGQTVQLVGFGSFSVVERSARSARNPRTGEPMSVAASKNVKFKAGQKLKDTVN